MLISRLFAEVPVIYNNTVFKKNIKTALIYREGDMLSYPIIHLKSDDKIKLSFDDLSNEVKTYVYTLTHCSSEWQPSDLARNEYIDGYTEDFISDYQYSFNSYFNYIHYSITLPNENMTPKISGNYILKVYEDYDEENVVLTKRFSIYEPKVTINATVKKPLLSRYLETGQEVDFSIHHKYYKINNPYNEIKVIISQNNDWNRTLRDLKPLFIKDNILDYNYSEENIFDGNNEYRYFDIKSLRYFSRYIKDITYDHKHFHVLLFPDESKQYKLYYTVNDINGKYLIRIQESENNETDADYAYVYFSLKAEYPFANGDVYVYGELTNWECNNNNKMMYNPEQKQYELTLLLKQGHYNYQYVFLQDGSEKINSHIIEGNHFETENDYIIYVYHSDISSRYDRLIGVKFLNSIHANKFK